MTPEEAITTIAKCTKQDLAYYKQQIEYLLNSLEERYPIQIDFAHYVSNKAQWQTVLKHIQLQEK